MKEVRTYDLTLQKEIAKYLNINTNTYKQYELQYVIIPIKHLNNFCNYFKVSLDYILELAKQKSYPNSNYEINLMLSGKRLKELRKINKLSQIQMADFLKTTFSMISFYERGKFPIATSYLYMICKKYKISADYLLGKIDYPKYLK